MNVDEDKLLKYKYKGSNRKNKMSLLDRAAQFAPFAALNGHFAKLEEVSRNVEQKRELSDEQIEENRNNINILVNKIDEKPLLKIIYFQKDKTKNGGDYFEYIGNLLAYNAYKNILKMIDGFEIKLEDIYLIYEIAKTN